MIETFEKARPRLLGLAYRMLGSYADAEDAVQDVFIKWSQAERKEIENPHGWLTTTCTRRCLDMMKSAHHQKVDYVGPWLPEPLITSEMDDLDAEFATSLTMAFLVVLERLNPKERAAYILREIFQHDYIGIADSLGITEAACRQLVSRAKKQIGNPDRRSIIGKEKKSEYVQAFIRAAGNGDVAALEAMLCDDVKLITDGGGKVVALRNVLQGREKVLNFARKGLFRFWQDALLNAEEINGEMGVVVTDGSQVYTCVTFDFRHDGKLRCIYITRNPEKLENIDNVLKIKML